AAAQHALVDAVELFDAALILTTSDPLTRFAVLREQNRVLRKTLELSRWQRNLAEQEEMLASQAMDDPRLALQWQIGRARYFGLTGDGVAAVAAAQAAVTLATSLDDRAALAESHWALGRGYWAQARLQTAGPILEQAAAYAREVGDDELEADSLDMVAATGMFSGMPMASIRELLTAAYQIAVRNGDKPRLASLHNKFGYAYVSIGMGDFARAEEEYRRGIALARAIGERRIEEMLLSNLGVLFTVTGEYAQAHATLAACLALGEADLGYWRSLVARHYLGAMWMQMGCLDAAQAELVHASDHLNAVDHHHFEVKARCDLGLCHHLAGNDRAAHAEFTRVLALIEDHGDLRFQALVNTRLGYVLEALGDVDGASRRYDHGYRLHRQMEQEFYALDALAGTARLALRRGDHAAALSHAHAIWASIDGRETEATVETARTLRTCYAIFCRHDDPHATAVLDAACAQLRRRVATIDDPVHAAQFWQLDDHGFFRAAATSFPPQETPVKRTPR
ncbi:MAG: hypothetical protein KDD83_05160, partial [Caldilineaceae bacterium]|nr:hypothetical protein [Caldilineaceae bacterium]